MQISKELVTNNLFQRGFLFDGSTSPSRFQPKHSGGGATADLVIGKSTKPSPSCLLPLNPTPLLILPLLVATRRQRAPLTKTPPPRWTTRRSGGGGSSSSSQAPPTPRAARSWRSPSTLLPGRRRGAAFLPPRRRHRRKGFSSGAAPPPSSSPSPTVLPFPVARHRSHGPVSRLRLLRRRPLSRNPRFDVVLWFCTL